MGSYQDKLTADMKAAMKAGGEPACLLDFWAQQINSECHVGGFLLCWGGGAGCLWHVMAVALFQPGVSCSAHLFTQNAH